MIYTIGSFNTHELTGFGKHDYDLLANIILKEGFDILALQEIKRAEAIEPLKSRLRYWEGFHGNSPESGCRGDYGLAFLWNTKRVKECSKDELPIIFKHKHSTTMIRKPFYGRFTPCGVLGGAFFEIRLVNVHLCWSSERSINDREKRIEEFKSVTGEIYDHLSHQAYGNFMPSYTIVLGDYNLSIIACNQYEKNSNVETEQSELTTISKDRDIYVSDYDHFSWEKRRFAGINVEVQRVDSVNKFLDGNFALHRNKVSDHVPIKMQLIFS